MDGYDNQGRLNDYMRQIIVNGDYHSGGEYPSILTKHNLHILLFVRVSVP